MRIPPTATPEEQAAWREVWQAIDRLGNSGGLNQDLKGRRVINAGDGIDPADYVTKRQLPTVVPPATSAELQGLGVSGSLRITGQLVLPRLTDGSKHHAILFVDSDGVVAVEEDGAHALDLNQQDGLLELGYGLILRWFSQAGLGSPVAGVVNATDAAGTSLLRFVLGLDDGTGIALTKNGTTLEIRKGGGGALTDLTCAALTANTVASVGAVSGTGISGTSFTVNGHAGVNFGPGALTSITIEKGIVTAAS